MIALPVFAQSISRHAAEVGLQKENFLRDFFGQFGAAAAIQGEPVDRLLVAVIQRVESSFLARGASLE